ncbi:nitric oxide-associated protein 1-like [Watersipora subatra]|uniref:nitric oxide-associated protein 1-like n=1 Tax=Watersipora subatra TaxID=2589382 RepID=UPI00355B9091
MFTTLPWRIGSTVSKAALRQLSKKSKTVAPPKLTSVLPETRSCSPTLENIDKEIANLDSMIDSLNLKIAEQQEQLSIEEKEMEQKFGVKLPAKYRSLIGSVDEDCPPSKYVCVGCGTPIHCCSPHQAGFISSTKFHTLDRLQLQNCVCLRCKGLEYSDTLLDTKVSPQEYRNIISSVKKQRSVILHIVDITDYENSTITDLLDLVGPWHPVYLIANKIDLLPKDQPGYLRHIKERVSSYANQCYGSNVKHVALISALTGYGVEPLITTLLTHASKYVSHIHLVGTTNSGKSTLFNTLLKSDLCKATARDKISQATTSLWPGTTLNLLKFPLQKLSKRSMAQRFERLSQAAQFQASNTKERNIINATPKEQVEATAEPVEEFSEEELKSMADKYNPKDIESNYKLSTMFNSIYEHKFKNDPSFDYGQYADSRWLYDTPGLVNDEQIINHLSMPELRSLLMKRMSLPRSFCLRNGMTLFIGGIGRIDIIEASGDYAVMLTVIAAAGLPVVVVDTENAEEFYQQALRANELKIPSAEANMDHFPKLKGHLMNVDGSGYKESLYDIQLSSLGWVSVSYHQRETVTLKAYTPGGVGCRLRPSLLPYAISRRGKRIRGSRSYALRKPLTT